MMKRHFPCMRRPRGDRARSGMDLSSWGSPSLTLERVTRLRGAFVTSPEPPQGLSPLTMGAAHHGKDLSLV